MREISRRPRLLPLVLVTLGTAWHPAWGFSESERAIIRGHASLIEVSSDSCRIASKLKDVFRRTLRKATTSQDVGDVLNAVEGAASIPVKIASGVRLLEGFALFDHETRTIYFSSSAIASRLPRADDECPEDAWIERFASLTVGVFVHETAHALEREALGGEAVETREEEVLAYAREARFLAGLQGWPSKTASAELQRRRDLARNIEINRATLALVTRLRDKPVGGESFDKLRKYVDILEANRVERERLQTLRLDADAFEVSLAEMVEAWRSGWPAFLGFVLPRIMTRPSLTEPENNLEKSARWLQATRAALEGGEEDPLARQVLERSLRLGEVDVRFWGDQAKVRRALEFYKRRFREVRPPPAPSDPE